MTLIIVRGKERKEIKSDEKREKRKGRIKKKKRGGREESDYLHKRTLKHCLCDNVQGHSLS